MMISSWMIESSGGKGKKWAITAASCSRVIELVMAAMVRVITVAMAYHYFLQSKGRYILQYYI